MEQEAANPLRGALQTLLSPPVLTGFAVLHGVLLAVVGLLFAVGLDGPLGANGQVQGGDFMAFYAAAIVVARGQGAQLYDVALQVGLQGELAGSALAIWQPFLNPPLFAWALSPLAALSYADAFRVFSLAMGLCGALGAWALIRLAPSLAGGWWGALTLVALVLGFHPMIRTMAGGQNTALTFALLTTFVWATLEGKSVTSGLLLGLLSYKPQYVPLLGLWLLLRRDWRAAGVAIVAGLCHYGLGVWLVGAAWPLRMLEALDACGGLREGENAAHHVSLIPFFQYLLGQGAGSIAAALSSLLALGLLVGRWPTRGQGPLAAALVITLTLLLSPHLFYYDFGLVALAVVLGLQAGLAMGWSPGLWVRLFVALVYVGYPVLASAWKLVGFQPLTLAIVGCYGGLLWLASRPQTPPPRHGLDGGR